MNKELELFLKEVKNFSINIFFVVSELSFTVMKILIQIPLQIEYDEIKRQFQLSSVKTLGYEGRFYEKGNFKGIHHNFEVILNLTGSKNTEVYSSTTKALQHLNPSIVILTGIAGGVKDVQIGDIVIADKLYGYESGKETKNGFVSRPELVYCSPDLVSFANLIISTSSWNKRNPRSVLSTAFIGPIASGDKVIASTESDIYKRLKIHFNDTLALEMEAIGFGKAMLYFPQTKFINVRGISDLLDNKKQSDESGSQKTAMQNVASFIFELIYQLDFNQLNLPIMDIKSMSETIFSIFTPFLKRNKSIKQITSEISEATNTTISFIWDKIKPIFIEEFEEDDALTEEAEEKSAVVHVLKKAMRNDETLKNALLEILEKETSQSNNSTIEISNSKNVIQGSNINIGGSFRVGDGN